MQLTQGLQAVGVSADNLPSSFNAIAYAQANVNGGADTLSQVLKRQAATINEYGLNVDQLVIIMQKLSGQGVVFLQRSAFFIRDRGAYVREDERDDLAHVIERHENPVALLQHRIGAKIALDRKLVVIHVNRVLAAQHQDVFGVRVGQGTAHLADKVAEPRLRLYRMLANLGNRTHDGDAEALEGG